MATTYSTYEAKARFSEVLRQVREEGKTITVSYRGEPVAEIRPVRPKPQTVEERLDELERGGELVRSGKPGAAVRIGQAISGRPRAFSG